MKFKEYFTQMPATLKESFIIILCFVILGYLLLVSVPPNQLGVIPGAVINTISSNEHYERLTNGIPVTEDELLENAEGFAGYYNLVIMSVLLAFVAGFILLGLMQTVMWNLILTQKFSLKSIGRGYLLNALILIIGSPALLVLFIISYFFVSIVGSISHMAGVITQLIVNGSIILFAFYVITMLGFLVVKLGSIKQAFSNLVKITSHLWYLVLTSYVLVLVLFVLLNLVSIPFSGSSAAMVVVLFAVAIPLAWIISMNYHLVKFIEFKKPKKSRK